MNSDIQVADPPDLTADDDREEVLSDLKEALDQAFYKFAGSGRIKDAERERIRVAYLKAFTKAVGEYRRLVDDLEEDEQNQRIERLESLVDELGE